MLLSAHVYLRKVFVIRLRSLVAKITIYSYSIVTSDHTI